MVRIPLGAAVESWRSTPRAPTNAYTWYRQSAQRQGTVYFGREIEARKEGGQWTVDAGDFEAAVAAHAHSTFHREKVQRRIEAHDFSGDPGATYEGSDGGYTVKGRYAFVWSNYQIARRKSDGSWYCRACGNAAGDPPSCLCGGTIGEPGPRGSLG